MSANPSIAANDPEPPPFTVHSLDHPTDDDLDFVDLGLDGANATVQALQDVRPLVCIAVRPGGERMGGIVGRTWGGCAELQQLWVHDDHRHQGVASALVRAFESGARARGARIVYLDTFSFQAPKLYQRLGYEVALMIEGYAPGICKYTMTHRLKSDLPDAPDRRSVTDGQPAPRGSGQG